MNHGKTIAATSAAVGLALALAMPGGSVWAQNAPAADQTAGAQTAQTDQTTAQGGATLQEVVVTAERRAENIQTTPISVVAVSGAQLAQQNITQIKSLQLTAPSVTIDDDGLYQSFNIRGIGNQAITPVITTGVAVLVDNLFSPETHGLDEPFYDIADVEVLRGPQGTFVGYSSTGGALEITTNNPNFRGTNGYFELNVGDYNDKRVDGAGNFVLSPTFAVRLAFNEEQRHSFYRDNGSRIIPGVAEPIQDPGSVDNKDIRLSGTWKPTDSFQALLKLDWNSSNDGGDVSQTNPTPFTVPSGTLCPSGSPTLAGPNGGSTCYAANYIYSSHSPYSLNWGPQAYLLPQLGHPYYNYRLGLHLDYTFPDGIDVRSVTGFQQTQYNTYGNGDSYPQTVTYATPTGCSVTGGGTPCTGTFSQNFNSSGAFYQWIPRDDYTSEEVDVLSPTTGPFWSKFNWIAGGTWFYRDTGVTVAGVTTTAPYSFERPFFVGINNDILNRIAGVFGQISWTLVPTLQLQVGARENWDNNHTRASVDEVGLPVLPTNVPNVGCTGAPYTTGASYLPSQTGYLCPPQALQSTSFQDAVPTGKIDLNWTPWQGQFFYAFYARGYKSGGAQTGAEPYQPEHVNDWELGWKGTMLDGRLQTHVGGYYMNYQGMQQVIYNLIAGTGTQIVNLGSSTLKGIETSVNARFGGLGINFNASYEKSTLANITGVVASYSLPQSASRRGQCGLPGVAPPPACFDYAPYEANIAGESDIFAPEVQGTLGVDYRILIGQGTLDPQVQYSYTGGQYASLIQIPFYYMGPRRIWNASLTYDVNQWNAELYINNFTNQVYLSGNSGNSVFYGAPKEAGIRVRRDF
ncbi:MAG: TonB-dependent receptor [Steroidobacteraceae bacterium]